MNRHAESKTAAGEPRESSRNEWVRTPNAEHQLESREHAHVSSKRRVLRSASTREDARQIRELGSR